MKRNCECSECGGSSKYNDHEKLEQNSNTLSFELIIFQFGSASNLVTFSTIKSLYFLLFIIVSPKEHGSCKSLAHRKWSLNFFSSLVRGGDWNFFNGPKPILMINKFSKISSKQEPIYPNMDERPIRCESLIQMRLLNLNSAKIKHLIKLQYLFCFVLFCWLFFCVCVAMWNFLRIFWLESPPMWIIRCIIRTNLFLSFTIWAREWFTWIYLGSFYLNLFDFIENSHFMCSCYE